MNPTPNKLEQIATNFSTTNDVEKKNKIASEVREQMEYILGHEYSNFLSYLFPVFYNFLREGKTEFRDSPENRLRNTILEIIARLPNTESLRPNVSNLLKLVMYLLEIENEENALICLRIIIDLHKSYRNKNLPLDREVDQFLKIVQTIYSNLPDTIKKTFTSTPSSQPQGSYETTKASPNIHSLQSFKVLTESPIIVVLLFQLYPPCLKQHIPKFMPLIIRTLGQVAPEGSYKRHRTAYVDFIASQVKTLSFLAYLLRGHAEHVKPYQDNIPKYAIQLLRNCPRESAAIRKELLIATRHILATAFRGGFFDHIDTLLDENVLIGTGRTAHDTLRPLAYSTLVDLVHHVRDKLSLAQISKIVYLYSRNIHDSSLPFSIQTMSSKLLLNLVESICSKNNPEIGDGRAILIHILDAFVNKFSSLKKQIPRLLEENEQIKDCRTLVGTLVIGLKNIVWGITSCSSHLKNSPNNNPQTTTNNNNPPGNSNVVVGNVNTTTTTNNNNTTPDNNQQTKPKLIISVEESLIFNRLFKNALQCFIIFSNGQADSFTQEEKENLEGFAQLFSMLDQRVFQDLFRMYLPLLFEHTVKNTAMLVIPQHFLVTNNVSRTFLEILLSFLMDRIGQLCGTSKEAYILARLFKFAFGSVAIGDNEMALKPYLTTIVNSCITYGSERKESAHYFGLLRSLFRAVAEGKYEWLYQEFLPLLPDLLRWLNKLLTSSHEPKMKDTFAELCLTVPVRLPALTPFLDLLMQPLIWALHSLNSDLVNQGLTTFDSLIQNLSADFIDPIAADIRQNLVSSVREHIQSTDSLKSLQALRILGKLAGNNRKFLYDNVPSCPPNSFTELPHPTHDTFKLCSWDWTGTDVTDSCLLDGFEVQLILKPDHKIPLSLGKSIYFAYKQILGYSTLSLTEFEKMQQQKSAKFLLTCLKAYLNESFNSKESLSEKIENFSLDDLLSSSPPETPVHQHKVNKNVLQTLLSSVIIIESTENINSSNEFKNIFDDVCRHFALLFNQQGFEENAITDTNLFYITPLVFIDTIIELCTSENENYLPAATNAITKLLEYSALLNEKPIKECADLPWCKYLIEILINHCYESDWYKKHGACHTLNHFIKILDDSPGIMYHLVDLIRGLIYAVKYSTLEILLKSECIATKAFKEVISSAVRIHKENPNEYNNDIFMKLISILMNETSSSNKLVRELVRESFKIVKSIDKDQDLSSIMKKFAEEIFTNLNSKRLSQLPIEHQIGNIDAITYFLLMDPPILSFRSDLIQLLQDALKIAEAGEVGKFQSLPSIHPQLKRLLDTQHIRKCNELETDLKKACISLLSAAMSCSAIKEASHNDFRNQIIGVFFKTLTFHASPVVDAAKNGLSQIIAHHKLPKDLLQSSLRPILLHLADYRKLTVSLLQGLSRLLELLTNCFNVTLGDKLLEHLQNWKEPAIHSIWKEQEAIDIASAIIHIFHLLPNAASKFLEPLITLVITLEKTLPRNISSPYRDNLILYLNKYPESSVDFFLQRMDNSDFSKSFQLILASPSATKLRENLIENTDKFLKSTLNSDKDDQKIKYKGIRIVYTIIKFIPDWLLNYPDIIQSLLNIWQSPGRYQRLNDNNMNSPLYYLRETKLLVNCFLQYCKKQDNGDEIPILLHMLSIFHTRTTIDYSFIKEYCKTDIVEKTNIDKKKQIIQTYLNFCKDPQIDTSNLQVQILRVLINPLLSKCFKRGEGQEIFTDSQLMKDVIDNILSGVSSKPPNPNEPQPSSQDEALSIELLRLATLLVQYIPKLLVDHRKELLRFAWNQLKSEDATNKQCANVLVCRFIEAYDTPPRNVLQVFIALLHYYQVEARQLVRKALDILTPMLKIRIPENDERFPTWIKWTKKILVEEGHTLPQLIHILQLLVRHPDLFYPCKGHFVPQIITSLPRIGLMSTCPPDNKKLTIDLVELIINWDKRRLKSHGLYPEDKSISLDNSSSNNNNEISMQVDDISTNNGSGGITNNPNNNNNIVEDDYKPSDGLVIVATNFLVRIVSMADTSRDTTDYIQRAQNLLREAFKIWPNVTVKLSYLESILDVTKQKPQMVLRGLQILEVILEHQLKQGMNNTLAELHRVISPALQCDDIIIVSRLSHILTEVVKSFPPQTNTPHCAMFYKSISETIENGLQQSEKGRYYSSIIILKTICSAAPEILDNYLPSLLRLLQKITKDHCTPSSSKSHSVGMDIDNNNSAPAELSEIILVCINLINTRIAKQTDHKRSFFTILLTLIEKSKNEKLLESITRMISGWLLGKDKDDNPITQVPSMTSKEKINFLLRMVRFEQFPELLELHKEFLDLIYFIYSDNGTTKEKKNERAQLEPGFMMGLRSPDPEVRGKFFNIFNNSIEKTLSARMNYILAIQNWESLGNHFWMKQALDLLLALRIGNQNINWMSSLPRLPPLCNNSNNMMDIDNNENSKMLDDDNDDAMDEELDPNSDNITKFYHNHQNFLSKIAKLSQKELIDSLRDAMNLNEDLSYHLWTGLFPKLWLDFEESQQERFFNAFILLVAKEYHHAQRDVYPNVIQALLEGLSNIPLATSPQNQLAFCQIIKYLGKTHNAWYFALHIIEKEYFRLSRNATHEDPVPPEFLYSLAELYQLLSEDDYFYSMYYHRCSEESDTACSAILLRQFGQWQLAQEAFFHLLHAQVKQTTNSNPPNTVTTSQTSDDDNLSMFWQEQILQCCKRLNQWDTLCEFAKSNNRNDILVESAWKLSPNPDWNTMKEITLTKTPVLLETSQFLIAQCYSLITEKKLTDVDYQLNKIHSKLLEEWNSLPRMPSRAHIPTLQQLQKLVELKESTLILEETSSQNITQSIAEVKNILLAWRERVPNTWEDITVWGDILNWRQFIFTKINAAYQALPNSPIIYIGFHETAWSINMFSHVARKHGLVDVCISSLAKIYNLPNIEIQDAFVKLREQLKCYSNIPALFGKGLDTINNTNLEYFTPQQKAEFYQLKGEFLSKLNFLKEANEAFASSVQLGEMIAQPTGWLSWGNFCDNQFESTKDPNWGECAITCYAKAASFRSRTARRKLGRALWLVSFKDSQDNSNQAQLLVKEVSNLPSWLWISWIPQLISGLYLKEAEYLCNILERIAIDYPQSLYYPLQRFIAELNQERMQTSSLLNNSKALEYAHRILAIMNEKHAALLTEMAILVNELEISLSPRAEIFTVKSLEEILFNCYVSKNLSESLDELNEFFSSEKFQTLGKTMWSPPTTVCEMFEEDFITQKPKTIEELTEKLRKWIKVICNYLQTHPSTLSLSSLSPALQQFENRCSTPLEVPGLYLDDTEPSPDGHTTIERFLPTVEKLGPYSFADYRLSLQASDGSIRQFFVRHDQNTEILSAEERFANLLRKVNHYNVTNHQMRSRVLTFNCPPLVNVSPTVQLIQTKDSFTSLTQMWNWACIKSLDPHEALKLYYEKLEESSQDALFLYNILCNEIPAETLSKVVDSIMPSYRQLFTLKSQFAAQLGLSGMMGHIFCIPRRSLDNISVSINTGIVHHKEYYPNYNDSFELYQSNSVPFRLSRNITEFINPFGRSGPYSAAMHGLSLTLDNKKKSLSEHIQLFLRDDIIHWSAAGKGSLSSLSELESSILANHEYIIGLCAKYSPVNGTAKSGEIYRDLQNLIQAASDAQNLSQLPPTYHPWF